MGFSYVLPAWVGGGGQEGTSRPWCPGPVGGHSLCPANSMKAQLGRGRPNGRRHHSPDRPSVSVYCPMLSHGATVGTRQQGPASLVSVINESSGVCQSTSVHPPPMTTGPEAVLEGTHRLQPVSHLSAEGQVLNNSGFLGQTVFITANLLYPHLKSSHRPRVNKRARLWSNKTLFMDKEVSFHMIFTCHKHFSFISFQSFKNGNTGQS